jgi:hypothetical protein
LFNLAAISSISLYIFYMIQKQSLPPENKLRPYVVSLFVLAIGAVVISVSCDTAALFCNTENGGNSRLVGKDSGVATYIKVVYVIAFVIPASVMNIFNLFGFGLSLYHIYTHVREILPLLRRLIANNFIIMMLYIPAAILFFSTTEQIAMNISSLLVSIAGVFFALSYFYFSIFVDRIMPISCLMGYDLESNAHLTSSFSESQSVVNNDSSMFEMRRNSTMCSENDNDNSFSTTQSRQPTTPIF